MIANGSGRLFRAAMIAVGIIAAVGLLGAYPYITLVVLVLWVAPLLVAYRMQLSKERVSPVVLAIFLSWLGVLLALALPRAGQRCRACDETIRRSATVCRFCGASQAVTADDPGTIKTAPRPGGTQ